MQPLGAFALLQNQLVEVAILDNKSKQFPIVLQVGGLCFEVLGVGLASHGFVELRAAVAACDDNRLAVSFPYIVQAGEGV